MGKTHKTKPPAHGPRFNVAITVLGRPATEEDRHIQMVALATAHSPHPSSSTDTLIQLLSSRVDPGDIVLSVVSQSHQAAVVAIKSSQEGIMVTLRRRPRRLIVGIPRFLTVILSESFVAHLKTHKPGLPAGSLQLVSCITEPCPSPHNIC